MSAATELRKWQNVSAGPRQAKDFNHAVSRLRAEGQTRDELTGVIGGKEDRWTSQAMFGPVRAEVLALDEAIRAKYDGMVTSANVRAIIAEYEAALPEARKSRPVDDNRRTPEDDAERNAASAARHAVEQAEQARHDALMAQVAAKAPASAKALIIAEYHEDASDSMTDYCATHTRRTVAIGFRHSSREDFRALHAAAAQFAETSGTEFAEHRDNHSMGAGNYLSDHGWAGAGTGWLIKSRDFPCRWVDLTEDAIPAAPATGVNGFYDQGGRWIPQAEPVPNGIRRAQPDDEPVTVCPSSIGRDGVVEVHFAEKPAADVIAGLKAHGFRWAKASRCWYGRDAAYAGSLASEVQS